MRRTSITLAALAWLGACGGEAPPPPPAEEPPPVLTRADSAELALAAFDSAVYDTIQWQSEDAAVERGGLVYRVSCMTCHGEGGRGNRGFIFEGDTLRPPSFVAANWPLARDPVGLRRRIFAGSVAGMPYWGLVGMTNKDVDAVARYITEVLR
jgi:mono/diheme cytochrome c family protein